MMKPTFQFIARNLALDFVNTVGNRLGRPEAIEEHLRSSKLLHSWFAAAGLSHPSNQSVRLRAARHYREAIYRVLKSAIDNRPPRTRDLGEINKYLKNARRSYALRWRQSPRLEWTGAGGVSFALAQIAMSVADLLTGPDLGSLKQCRDEHCGWLFLDNSQGHRRKWCSMQDCGNRAKARRFYRDREARGTKVSR